MDEFFKTLVGKVEVVAQAYRIARSEGRTGEALAKRIRGLAGTPGSPAWTAAIRQAEAMTFQSELPEFLKKVTEWKEGRAKTAWGAVMKTMLKFIFPFIRTPWNIFATGLRKTPLGGVAMGARGLGALYKMKDGKAFFDSYPKALFAKHMVEQAVGWLGAIVLFGLAEGDEDDDKKFLLITGTRSPDDRMGEKKMLERTRGGATMIVINGKPVFNYGRIEPFSTMVSTVVDSVRAIKRAGRGARATDQIAAIIGNIKDQTESKTFLQGIANLSRTVDMVRNPDRVGKELARGFIQGVVPNIIRQPLRNLDNYARDTRHAPLVYSAFPLGGLAEPLYDLYGRPVEKTGTPFSRLLLTAGTDTSRESITLGDKALSRWNAANPLETYYPSPDLITRFKDANGEWQDMTPAEIALQRREGGKRMAQKVSATVTPAEAAKPTAETKEKIEGARRSAFREARDHLFKGGQRPVTPQRTPSLAENLGWNIKQR